MLNRLHDDRATALAELFRTLGDSARIVILAALAEQERDVGELAELAGLSPSATSHHLRHLRQTRLVATSKRGRHVYYRLDDGHVGQLLACGLDHVEHG
jgi:DNA-binding transcriptional ArsR family regulator